MGVRNPDVKNRSGYASWQPPPFLVFLPIAISVKNDYNRSWHFNGEGENDLNVHHHHHYYGNTDTQTLPLLQQILTIVKAIQMGEKTMIQEFNDLKVAVLAEVEVDKAVETLVDGLVAQIKALGENPTPAQLAELTATLTAEKKTLGDLVAANTAAPAPIVTPAAAAVIVAANPLVTPPVVDTGTPTVAAPGAPPVFSEAQPAVAPAEAPAAAPVTDGPGGGTPTT